MSLSPITTANDTSHDSNNDNNSDIRAYFDAEAEKREIAEGTVEELNRCLDQLEHIQATSRVGAMAVHKVVRITRFAH